MAVTRLERKAARNKTRAQVRVKDIKRHKTRVYLSSPYKEESGIILEEDSIDVAKAVQSSAAAAPKAKAPKVEKVEVKAEEAPEAVAEETPVAEAAEVVEEAPAKPAKKAAKKDAVDKLNKIEGIGPKIASVLNEGGINSFSELASSTPEAIREILDNAEGNFKAHDPATWPEQATMAAAGDWDALKVWQDDHVGGKAKS